ncbi:MAG: diphosphomevalonate decarboxylase [Bdellovibrionales bacterium]
MVKQGKISVQAPSNIAFVKYWGKTGRQHPINPSISMTLKHCLTTCSISYRTEAEDTRVESFRFSGEENEKFKARIEKYLNDISDVVPALQNLSLSIETDNTFPHSAGIASSASAFAAIGYALAHIEHDLGFADNGDIETRASTLARLGSGSAGRSVVGPYNMWGEYAPENSTDDYAVKVTDIHEEFNHVKDAILLIDAGEKKVSSSAGHKLMDNHPYRQARIDQAIDHTKRMIDAMRTGDWDTFGEILENDALALHTLMMTSSPSFILLAPNSLEAIERIRDYRKQTGLPVYFTIDAGPNIHLIYPKKHEDVVEKFIADQLKNLCQNGKYIIDECGKGACVIKS